MKLNKTHLHQTLQSMVAASTVKAGSKLVKRMIEVRTLIAATLQKQALNELPELNKERQLDLIQKRILDCISTNNFTVAVPRSNSTSWDSEYFANFVMTTVSKSQAVRETDYVFYRLVVHGWANTQGHLSFSYNTYYVRIGINGAFPGIADVSAPTSVYPESHDKWSEGYNSLLLNAHQGAKAVGKEIGQLLLQANTMLADMIQATITCTTVEKLLEYFPEAEKHLPEEVRAVKPTKQVADPKVINDIRAKLAAGLPV